MYCTVHATQSGILGPVNCVSYRCWIFEPTLRNHSSFDFCSHHLFVFFTLLLRLVAHPFPSKSPNVEPTISQKLAIEHARLAGACEWIVKCCELADVALALGQRAGQYMLGILTGMHGANADLWMPWPKGSRCFLVPPVHTLPLLESALG